MVDAIAGTVLTILLVKVIQYFDFKYWQTGRLQSGFYGRPPLFSTWLIQSSVWVLITAAVKAILLWCVLIPLEHPLYLAGTWLMLPFQYHPKWELFMVMIVIPLVMNALVFWNTDAWIMNSQHIPEYANYDDPADEFPCCRRTPKMEDAIAPEVVVEEPHLTPPNGDSSSSSSSSSSSPTIPSSTSSTTPSTPEPVTAGGLHGGAPQPFLRGGASSTSAVPSYFFGPPKPKVNRQAQRIRSEDYHRL